MSGGGIKIPVSAELSAEDITKTVADFERRFNALGAKIAAASKGVHFEPVKKSTIDDVKRLEAAFQSLVRVSGDLRNRMRTSGQHGASFLDLDWGKLFPGGQGHQRDAVRFQAFQHVSGNRLAVRPPGVGGNGGGSAPSGGGVLGGVARQVGGAALGAMGPAGSVAAGAMGTAAGGGGLMAGLAGLGGGLAALAISKAVGAIVGKISDVERENIRTDLIKRRLGDVGVGFGALKAGIRGASSQIGVTFEEGQGLVEQYIRQAGIHNRDWRSVGQETATVGGFSRSFGLDPSQGTSFFAQMRMNQVTGNDQQNRRLAMLIGEGIAKSDAFSKADEVLEAIAGYTAQQTRTGMNSANAEGYTSMLAGMVGSKIPGMDVASSAALLSRMNSAVAGGGAAGEAGQNFLYAALGGRGMDPMDVAVLQEQGLFGTGRKTFSAGSTYSRYASKYGLGTPDAAGDDRTNFELIQKHFERTYGNTPEMRKLMANAMSKLYGINNSQAMAISTIDPAQLGGVGRRLDRLGIDVKDVNAAGISRIAQIEGDGSLSEHAKDEQVRKAAKEGQEATPGSIARDSKAALENIASTLADRLVPLAQGTRDAVMFLAGGSGKMSGRQIQEAMMTADSEDRKKQIREEFRKKMVEEALKPDELKKQRAAALEDVRRDYADPEKRSAAQARVQALSDQIARQEEASRTRILQLKEEQEKAISGETDALKKNIQTHADEEAARRKAAETIEKARNGAQDAWVSGAGAGRGSVNPPLVGGGNSPGSPVNVNARSQEAMNYFMGQGWSREQAAGIVANLNKESSFRHDAVGDGGKAFGIAQWHPDRQADFKQAFGKDIRSASYQEQLAFVQHELTAGKEKAAGDRLKGATNARDAGAIVSRHYERPGKTEEIRAQEAAERGAAAVGYAGTPIPDTGGGRPGDREQRVTVEVRGGAFTLQDERGRQLAQTQSEVSTRVAKPQPTGAS